MTGRVLRTRVAVRADLRRELGELSTPDWLANQLAAIAILDTSVDLDQLLDLYLEARKVGKSTHLYSSKPPFLEFFFFKFKFRISCAILQKKEYFIKVV